MFLLTCSKVIRLLQSVFICAPVVSFGLFVLSLIVSHLPSFGTSGGFCFVVVAFPFYVFLISSFFIRTCITKNIVKHIMLKQSKIAAV